jgi:stage V sporulation protein S
MPAVDVDDPNILRVRGNTPPRDLAAAISHGVYDGREVVLRAIGAAAVNVAVKAIAIAQSLTISRGIVLHTMFGFQDVPMPDRMTTSIIFKVLPQ